jgi:hypothetical protein
MERNVRGLRCDKCWCVVEALYRGRFGGLICYVCWAWQSGDTPKGRRVEPVQVAKPGQ